MLFTLKPLADMVWITFDHTSFVVYIIMCSDEDITGIMSSMQDMVVLVRIER